MFNTSLEYNPSIPPPTTEEIKNYLLFWQTLELSDSSFLENNLDVETRLTTLMKVFHLSEDVFLEEDVAEVLMSIFSNLTKSGTELNASIFSGPKFTGFLEDFISQFSAVSYGSSVFASVLFIFLRAEFPFISSF